MTVVAGYVSSLKPDRLLLLAASVVSGATGDVSSACIISAIVLLSVGLDFVQEHRAGILVRQAQREGEHDVKNEEHKVSKPWNRYMVTSLQGYKGTSG